jgi:4-amino-4-deoxy-L-arabinose transferase-like glycosyltransferase
MDFSRVEKIGLAIVCLLCIPAFFINLGNFPFIEDEGIRAVVAYEMLHNGNYIVPRINGEAYYNKPPLYNWLLALSYSIFGAANEWTSRIPTVLLLFGFTYSIYRVIKRHTGHLVLAASTALTFLTCGRVLFYDSFLGLIDIGFSWVIFIQLTLLYQVKDKPKRLFIIYLLTAIAYMLKGLPSLVFLFGGLLAYLVFYRDIKSLLTKWHFIGMAILGGIIGGYYWLYSLNHTTTSAYTNLVDQSTMRTFMNKDVLESIKHLFLFPIENVYHFLPWSILTICGLAWYRKWQKTFDTFPDFMGLLFMANIPVYWLSPGTFPRYIIMLIPLYFGFFLASYFKHREALSVKVVDWILLALIALVSIAGLSIKLLPIDGSTLTTILGMAVGVIGLILLFAIKRKQLPVWLAMVILLLVIRIQFNFSLLPTKNIRNGASASRTEAKRIATDYQPLYLYKSAKMDRASSFYLGTTQGGPLERKQEMEDGNFYIYDSYRTDTITEPHIVVDSLKIVEFQRMTYIARPD